MRKWGKVTPNNSFKPTPHRGVNSVLCATLHAVATPLWGGLTPALYVMPTLRLPNQKIAGTSLDSQGERLELDVLKAYCDYCRGRRVPLHQKHSMGEPTLGYIENVRLMPDESGEEGWNVVGDVVITQGTLPDGLRGFSLSFTAPLVEAEDPEFLLYIPYPHYNDRELVEDLASDSSVKIGKWIKKSAEVSELAIFGLAISFWLRPVWDDLYKNDLSPRIRRFLSESWPKLKSKGLALEHLQIVIHSGREIELRFIPDRGKEEACLSPEQIQAGIRLVAKYLNEDHSQESPEIERIVLRYAIDSRCYEIARVEHRVDV